MKERILHGWTPLRLMYVLMGGMVIYSSIAERQWMGIIFGGYFASMGVFAFGCAAGNCGVPAYRGPKYKQDAETVEYEEIVK